MRVFNYHGFKVVVGYDEKNEQHIEKLKGIDVTKILYRDYYTKHYMAMYRHKTTGKFENKEIKITYDGTTIDKETGAVIPSSPFNRKQRRGLKKQMKMMEDPQHFTTHVRSRKEINKDRKQSRGKL